MSIVKLCLSGEDTVLVKTQYVMTQDAVDIINASATERKRGEWISRVIVEYSRLLSSDDDAQECGVLEQINRRLDKIEKRTAVLVSSLESNQQ